MDPAEVFDSVGSRIRSWSPTVGRWLKKLRGAEWIGLVLIGVLFVYLLPLLLGLFYWAILLAVVIALALFWVGEFARLMRTSETDFPGRHDRLVWIIVMVVLLPIGALAFWTFRRSHWENQSRFRPYGKPESPWIDRDLY